MFWYTLFFILPLLSVFSVTKELYLCSLNGSIGSEKVALYQIEYIVCVCVYIYIYICVCVCVRVRVRVCVWGWGGWRYKSGFPFFL